jgi:hypothetical protein
MPCEPAPQCASVSRHDPLAESLLAEDAERLGLVSYEIVHLVTASEELPPEPAEQVSIGRAEDIHQESHEMPASGRSARLWRTLP